MVSGNFYGGFITTLLKRGQLYIPNSNYKVTDSHILKWNKGI